MYRGVDVSGYHGKIDWNRAKTAGVEFAVLKVIRKDLQPDKEFENNWAGCRAAGVIISGVYNYTYASTISKAVTDAKGVLDILGKDRHPFVWLHWEAKCLPRGREAAEIINAYGDVITAGGCRFGVCFGRTFQDKEAKEILPFVKLEYQKGWEMRYPFGGIMKISDPVEQMEQKNPPEGNFQGWQYSDKGRVEGIRKKVSLNVWYEDREAEQPMIPWTNGAFHLLGVIWEQKGIWNVVNVGEKLPLPSGI